MSYCKIQLSDFSDYIYICKNCGAEYKDGTITMDKLKNCSALR